MAGLLVAAVAALVLDIATGPSDLTLEDAMNALLGTSSATGQGIFIVWQLRLPQALLAVLVGCALGLAGSTMQTVLDNPLADPFTLGVSAAAAFGAALAIVLGIGIPHVPDDWIIIANAFVFALASLLTLLFLARTHLASAERLILFGIAMGFTFGALLALLQFVASPDALQQLTFWSLGSLVRANWSAIAILTTSIVLVLPFLIGARWQMNVLRFGTERARTLGVDVTRLRVLALLCVSLLAAVSVSLAGIVGFVGLTGPHIARMLIGDDHRFLVPASALVAMIVMSLAAAVSKAAMPGIVIPIGIVTALLGLPVFFSLLMSRRGAP